jgi:hypothetical protein
MPLPALLYAQVVKSYRRRRLVGVTHHVVFGTQLAVEQVVAACGWTIQTAFVERLNLDIRQRVAAIGRRVNTLCQGEVGLRDQLTLFHVGLDHRVGHLVSMTTEKTPDSLQRGIATRELPHHP